MNIYFTDGTPDNFYSAVFDAYTDKAAYLTSRKNYQLAFDDRETRSITHPDKKDRVKRKLYSYDKHSLSDIDYILRSDGEEKEQTAFLYLKKICEAKAPVRDRFADKIVFQAGNLIRRVSWEADKFYGFLRFTETKSGIFYAPYEPDCDITELIAPHFSARLATQKFIIHDLKRKKAFLYNGEESLIIPMQKTDIVFSDDEEQLQLLWKKYYQCIHIASREHLRQMKAYMPIRYWKHLPEKN